MSESNLHARLEAFCDGVFAIAITLLILEIKIPRVGSFYTVREFWHQILKDWPSWFGFTLSFIIILVTWENHRNILKMINKSSAKFSYANGFMLFTVVLFPFTTGLMSEYLATGLAQPAITIYCFSILMHNISWVLFGRTALYPVSLFKDHACHDLFGNVIYKSIRYAFLYYFSLCLLSFWYPYISMVLMTVSWIYWVYTAIIVQSK